MENILVLKPSAEKKIEFKDAVRILLELSKFRITIFVAVSTSVGYILASGKVSTDMILPNLGVFLLACGSSALNHYQERTTDALMERTKGRPLPSGRIKPVTALIIIALFLSLGMFLLYISSDLIASGLGVLAVLWYNLFYTPLKKVTSLAVVPGALIGAIPPAIGWVSGGGSIFDPEVFALSMFFFIWQVPHFWLLMLIYSRDYERAGFPILNKLFSSEQLSRIIFVWIVTLTVSSLMIPLFGLVSNNLVSNNLVSNMSLNLLLLISGLWMIWQSRGLLALNIERVTYRFAFKVVNIFVLFVVLLLSLNKIIKF